jgi:hypothetical protein
MPTITLDEEQQRKVLLAAGNRWNAVRNAMGIDPSARQPGTLDDNPPPGVDTDALQEREAAEVLVEEQTEGGA